MTRSMLPSMPILAAMFVASPTGSAQWVEPATPILTIPGRAVGDLFGWRVRNVGDVNSDGIADIAVAAPFESLNLGRVSVHSGTTGVELWGRTETATSSIFGFDLAVIEDVNNDGAMEVVASAPFASAVGGLAHVLSGRTGQVLHTFTGNATVRSVGYSIATGGDFDGDGTRDIAIGAVDDTTVRANAGRVYVHSTRGFGLVATIDPLPADFDLGTSLAFVGDTNRDGRDELAVGSRIAATGSRGSFHLVGWSGTAPVFHWTVPGIEYGSGIDGNRLAGRGDVNGDGVPDIITDEGTSIGNARVYSGATGGLLHTIMDMAGDASGTGALIVPDQNADGMADMLVGAARNSTQGRSNGRLLVKSGRDARTLRQLTHTIADARFGFATELVPDRTNDGFPELLIAAPGVSGTTRTMGAVHVIAGDPCLAGWRTYGNGLGGPSGVPSIRLARTRRSARRCR